MADEIFRHDGYTFEFEAHVVSVTGDEVVLDCTAFYPGGGGQVCDTGYIRGKTVKEVFYKGDEIVHIVPDNDLKVGERIWCSVDWDRRYDLMQGHTGEHLLLLPGVDSGGVAGQKTGQVGDSHAGVGVSVINRHDPHGLHVLSNL